MTASSGGSAPAAAPTAQPFSEPVFATTLPHWGDPAVPGENLRTQWEMTQAAQFTSDVNEYAYTAALDAASDRVRVVEIGRTSRTGRSTCSSSATRRRRPTVEAVADHDGRADQLQRARQRAVVAARRA